MAAIDQETNLEILKDDVMEGSTATFTTEAGVVDENGDPITALATLTMSIYDYVTKAEIVKDRDVSGGFDSATSKITVILGPADNIIVDHRKTIEKHILRFDFTYDSGASTGVQPYVFRVINVHGAGRGL